MASCPTSGDDLDQKIIQAAKDAGSETVGASTSVGMVLRSGKRLGGMKGGERKCSLIGITLCSLIFIAAAWAAFSGCSVAVPVLIEYLNKTMPGAIGNAFSVGETLAQYLSDQFEGICLLVKAQMKMKGDTAFKVIFDELMKNPLSAAGAATAVSVVLTKALSLGSSATSQISSFAMEICERGGLIIDSDGSAGAAAGRAAMGRASSAVPGGSRRKMRRNGSKGKKCTTGGRRRSMGKSKKNKK